MNNSEALPFDLPFLFRREKASASQCALLNLSSLLVGDLGRIVDGRLFVTGRIKNIIVVRGHNVYPQDIERSVQDTEEQFLRPGGVVAVQVKQPRASYLAAGKLNA